MKRLVMICVCVCVCLMTSLLAGRKGDAAVAAAVAAADALTSRARSNWFESDNKQTNCVPLSQNAFSRL